MEIKQSRQAIKIDKCYDVLKPSQLTTPLNYLFIILSLNNQLFLIHFLPSGNLFSLLKFDFYVSLVPEQGERLNHPASKLFYLITVGKLAWRFLACIDVIDNVVQTHLFKKSDKKDVSDFTSETDKNRSLSVYCCTFSKGWPVKAAYILSIFCINEGGEREKEIKGWIK